MTTRLASARVSGSALGLFAVGLVLVLVLGACGSSSSSSSTTTTTGDGGGSCIDLAGTWKITAHCDASFIGQSVVVTQSGCMLSFAAPFNGFSGTTSGSSVALSGAQTCNGNATDTSISMSCTPGTCAVALAR
jgi:hypothetical protein